MNEDPKFKSVDSVLSTTCFGKKHQTLSVSWAKTYSPAQQKAQISQSSLNLRIQPSPPTPSSSSRLLRFFTVKQKRRFLPSFSSSSSSVLPVNPVLLPLRFFCFFFFSYCLRGFISPSARLKKVSTFYFYFQFLTIIFLLLLFSTQRYSKLL